jgi:endonuclease YncB( thermonuclease family)
MRTPPVVSWVVPALVACKDPIGDIPILGQDWCDTDKTVTIERVLDGDTIDYDLDDASDETVVRFLGTAAPEIAHGDEPAECYGDEAADFMTEVALDRRVRLLYDVAESYNPGVDCTNPCGGLYCRTLGWLQMSVSGSDPIVKDWLEPLGDYGLQDDGTYTVVLNALIVRAGFARKYDGVGSGDEERFPDLVQEAEDLARAEGRGLWSDCAR